LIRLPRQIDPLATPDYQHFGLRSIHRTKEAAVVVTLTTLRFASLSVIKSFEDLRLQERGHAELTR